MTQRNDETVQLVTVGQSEIDEMLEFYDTEMSDRTTQNAVALALRKILKEDIRLKVFHDEAHHSFECQIEEKEFPLPKALAPWLERAEHFSPISPFSFPVLLPRKWLRESSSDPLREPKTSTEESKAA